MTGHYRRHRRGLGLAEVLVSALIACITLFTFLSVFRSSYQLASETRNRAVAIQMARSWMDEIEAHPYGQPAPAAWTDGEELPVKIVVQGKAIDMTFHRKLEYLNRTFVTSPKSIEETEHFSRTWHQPFDVVTLTISWRENIGDRQTGDGSDNKNLIVQIPVWQ